MTGSPLPTIIADAVELRSRRLVLGIARPPPPAAGLSRRPAPDFCFRLQPHKSRAPFFATIHKVAERTQVSDPLVASSKVRIASPDRRCDVLSENGHPRVAPVRP